MSSATSRLLTIVVLLMVLLLGLGITVVLPPGEGFDEIATLRQARLIGERGLTDATGEALGEAGARPQLAALAVGGLDAVMPGHRAAHELPTRRLPYERSVGIHGEVDAPDRLPPSHPRFRLPRLFRVAGVLLGLITAVVLFVAARRMAGASGPHVVLAAAAVVMLPGFVIVFATPSNLVLVALCGCVAWTLLSGLLPSMQRTALSGLLIGIAFLGGLAALVPLVGALCLLATSWLPWKGRLGRMAVLMIGPLLLGGGWWTMREVTTPESGLPVGVMEHPGVHRAVPLVVAEGTELLAAAFRRFAGTLSDGMVTPSELWMVPAGLLLPVTLLLAMSFVFRSDSKPRARRASWVLIAGFAAALLALVLMARERSEPDVRLLHLLDLPAVVVLAHGAQTFLGRRSAVFLGWLAILSALGGPLLLHGGLLPRFHSQWSAPGIPGGVLYLDLGHASARTALEKGDGQKFYGLQRPHPDLRMAVGRSGEEPGVAVRLKGLAPRRDHLLSVRVAPPVPGFRLGTLSHVDFRVGQHRLSGMLSNHGRFRSWIHMALPRADASSRSLLLEVRGVGEVIGVSQIVVREVPIEVGKVHLEGDHLQVPLYFQGESMWGEFTARLVARDGAASEPVKIEVSSGRTLRVRFPVPASGAGELKLAIELPAAVSADVKAVVAVSPEALRTGVITIDSCLGGAVSAPGCLVLKLDPKRHAGRAVLQLGEQHLPPGSLSLVFLDASGGALPPETFELEGDHDLRATPRSRPLNVLFTGKRPVQLDRILVERQPRWSIPLEVVR